MRRNHPVSDIRQVDNPSTDIHAFDLEAPDEIRRRYDSDQSRTAFWEWSLFSASSNTTD
jgi:hypothetical protein